MQRMTNPKLNYFLEMGEYSSGYFYKGRLEDFEKIKAWVTKIWSEPREDKHTWFAENELSQMRFDEDSFTASYKVSAIKNYEDCLKMNQFLNSLKTFYFQKDDYQCPHTEPRDLSLVLM